MTDDRQKDKKGKCKYKQKMGRWRTYAYFESIATEPRPGESIWLT